MHPPQPLCKASHYRKTVMLNAVNALIEFIQEVRAADMHVAQQ